MAENKEEKVEGEETTTIGENTEETTNDEVVEETTANEETEIKQSEPVIEQIDIAVVGGGVAGVYAAYKLQRRYPKKKIYVYEATGQLGGNQYSPPNNSADMAWLKGALHTKSDIIPSEQVLTTKLINDATVDLVPPTDISADGNFFEYDGKSTKLTEVIINNDNKYEDSNDNNMGQTPSEYIKNALDRFFQEFPEEKVQDPYSSKRLRVTTVMQCLSKYTNELDAIQAIKFFGEDIEVYSNMSLASFLHIYPTMVASPESIYRVEGGLQNLVVNVLAVSRCELQLGWKLEGVAIDNSTQAKHLRLWSNTANAGKTVVAESVIMCVPPKCAKEIGTSGSEILEGQDSLMVRAWKPPMEIDQLLPVPHFKAFLKWKVPWWTALGIRTSKSVCSNRTTLQNIQYCASGILIVHCTGERANYLKDQFDNNNEEIMRIMLQELRLAHGFQGDDNSKIKDLNVTDTAEVLYKYWEDGTYTWGKDSDASTTLRKIQCGENLSDGVFLCGSAYSKSPGWVESALQSIENILQYVYLDENLWDEVSNGNVAAIEQAVEEGKDLFTVDRSNGQTLLHKAASNGDADMVDLLLANGLDPNQQDSNGRCPLHWACVCGHDTIVEMLLSNGANAQLEDNNNATSFQLARNEGHAKVLLTLSTRHLLKHWSRLQEPPPCEEGLVNIPSANGDMVIRNEEQLKADLERVWLQIDEHGRGIIDSNKLGDLTSNLGQTLNEDEMDEMIRALCSGKSSGKVTFANFFSYWCSE